MTENNPDLNKVQGDKPVVTDAAAQQAARDLQVAQENARRVQQAEPEEKDLESQFKKDLEEVSGKGTPTRELRVYAFNNGYMLRTTDNGWIATKRS